MRKKIVAGNWKMNTLFNEAEALVIGIREKLKDNPSSAEVIKILCPPFPYLKIVSEEAKHLKNCFTGAQNCSHKESGAFTGEVSARMIKSVGATYIIVGHSERRTYFNETNEMIKQKITQVVGNNLIPIFCLGESLAERKENLFFKVAETQLNESLFHLNSEDITKVIIAYEPVWAIGTGLNATPQQAQEMHRHIRKVVENKYGTIIASNLPILYGGSCNTTNAKELFACHDVDGGLIGGASLIANDFVNIIDSFKA